MSDPRSKELIQAEKLINRGKTEDAYKIILKYEKEGRHSPKDQIYSLLLKGWVFRYEQHYQKAVDVGELVYQLCKESENFVETIEAFLLMAQIVFLGKYKESLDILNESEKLLKIYGNKTTFLIARLEIELLSAKAWVFFHTGEYPKALDLSMRGLELVEKMDLKLRKAYFLYQVGYIYQNKGKIEKAHNYQMKSLGLFRELNNQVGIATSLSLIGVNYHSKGELDQAQKVIKQSLAIEEISKMVKNINFIALGTIYRDKGELTEAIKYMKRVEESIDDQSILFNANNLQIGKAYRLIKEYNLALKYLLKVLNYDEKKKHSLGIMYGAFYLLLISLDQEFHEKTKDYLTQMNDLAKNTENKIIKLGFNLANALVLKESNRRRNLTEAETILRSIINDDIIEPDFYILSLVLLCDLFLEELSMYNNPEVIEEIDPLISRLLNIARQNNSSLWLAEGTLLRAKLALIQTNIESARKFLIEAQVIAESHGLKLLAQSISSEHDKLLEQIDKWNDLKSQDSSMADRVELASFDGVLDRFQGKKAVDPPELIEEESILLLIMDNSGVTYFNYPFVSNWDYSDLFSSFMSAFNTFSSEIFSKSIDRVKIGENTILINPIESFLACYVIKGQSYPALQKLTRFSTAIKENKEIWQALNNSVKTSEVLELNNPPSLKSVVNEIFTQQS